MSELSLNINLGEYESDQFQQAVVDAAARKLLSELAGIDEDGFPHDRPSPLAVKLTKKIDDAMAELAKDKLSTFLDDLLSRPLQKVNAFGERVDSRQQTVGEALTNELHEQLTRRGSGRLSNDLSLLQRTIKEQSSSVLEKELADEVKAAREEVRQAIKDGAAEIIAKNIQRAVGA